MFELDLICTFVMAGFPKNYLNELQNPPVNKKDSNEDINKVVKFSWIPITGPKLRQAFKRKTLRPFLH